jgi:hypothetical protein
MFDVNVTTDQTAAEESNVWGWILISNDASGGRGNMGSTAISALDEAYSYVGSSTVTSTDKCRRVAHELGHNFQLEHSGVWDSSTFYKWEDWSEWDYVYGPIMGGGGYGDRNGWSYGYHSDDEVSVQDTMALISQRIISEDSSSEGWSEDDFDGLTPYPLCDDTPLYRNAVLNHPDDVDLFAFEWAGGDLTVTGSIPGVSAAVLDIEVLDSSGAVVGGEGTTAGLAADTYTVSVKSEGGYAEIGAYGLTVE